MYMSSRLVMLVYINPLIPSQSSAHMVVCFQVGVMPGEESMEVSGKGRVFASGYKPGLATARAFGDWDSKAVGVTATPDFRCITLTPADEVLIIASDGVWEILGETEVVATCMSYAEERDAEMAAEVLVQVSILLLLHCVRIVCVSPVMLGIAVLAEGEHASVRD
jgi:hypothetical protein